MKITTMLVVALTVVGAFALAQDPGFQLSPPPAVAPAPAPPAFQVPVFITNPALPQVDSWQWAATYVLAPISIAIVGFLTAWLGSLQGRMNRQSQKTGQMADQIVNVAAQMPPSPAATPGTPSSAPRTPPLGLWPILAAVVALGLVGCAVAPTIGNIAYTDASGNHYTWVTNPDGTKTLTLSDAKGNPIGLTSDGKQVAIDVNATNVKGLSITPPVAK